MLNQYMVVMDDGRYTGDVHKLPFNKGKADIVTEGLGLSAKQAVKVATLLNEARDDGWNGACESMKQYCDRVKVSNVRRG